MTLLFPLLADEGVLEAKDFLRTLRSSRKVRQSRFNKVFRHDEPCGFQTWVGGPPFAVRPTSLTIHRVYAHAERTTVRVVSRLEPHPPSSAALSMVVEVGDVRCVVAVPHTRAAATVELPVELPMALSGPLTEPATCFPDALAFEQAERARVGVDGAARAVRSLVDLGSFGSGGGAATVSGVVERIETVSSSLAGDATTLTVRTAGDIPLVVWCGVAGDPPVPGAVFTGQVALCGSSDQLV